MICPQCKVKIKDNLYICPNCKNIITLEDAWDIFDPNNEVAFNAFIEKLEKK